MTHVCDPGGYAHVFFFIYVGRTQHLLKSLKQVSEISGIPQKIFEILATLNIDLKKIP